MRLFRTSFVARLIAQFLAISILGGTITTATAFLLARAALTQSMYDRLNTAATLKEDALARLIREEVDELHILSRTSDVRLPLEQMSKNPPESPSYLEGLSALREYLHSYHGKTEGEELFVMAPVGGQVLASNHPASEGTYHATDAYFTQGRRDTFVQNFYPSPQTGKTSLTISTPVLDQNSQLLGVLAIHVDLESLDAILQERTGLGATGETYLVDRFNNFISAARYGERTFPRGVHTLGIDAALSGQSGTALYENYEGTSVLGAYRWLPEREAALLVEISQDEALAPARRLARTTFLVSALLLLVLSFGVYAVARQVAAPILSITEAARRVAEGELTARTQVRAQDEIGMLARNFNRMAEHLQGLIGELEQRVAERTRALERKSNQLSAAARVARQAVEFQDITTLLTSIARLISEQFNFYHAGIFLLDETGAYAILQAASSEGGQRMLSRGHRLKVGEQGIVGYVAAERRPRLALDVGRDAVFFDNPDLPQTRSEMALPLMARGRVIGVLDIQSTEEAAFSADDVEVMRTLADQIAIAIDNARLLAESQALVQQLQATVALQTRQAWHKYLRRQRQGYVYTPLSVTPLSEAAQTPSRETASQLRLPILLRGQEIGAITLRRQHGMRWTQAERELVEKIGAQVALALDNSRLLEETRQRALQEQTLSEISARLARSLDLDTLLRTAARELGSLPEVAEVSVFIGQENGAPPIQDAKSERAS